MKNIDRQVYDYLSDTLNPAQRLQFEAQLSIDADLRQALSLAQEQQAWHRQGLPEAAALLHQVIQERKQACSRTSRRVLMWWSLGLTLILGLSLYYYLYRKTATLPAPPDATPQQALPIDTPTSIPLVGRDTLKREAVPFAPRTTDTVAVLASARNPYLDALMEERVRNAIPAATQLKGLPKDTVLQVAPDGTVLLTLRIITTSQDQPAISIYPHSSAAFVNGRPILEAFPTFWKATSEGYEYRFIARVPLSTGVYYTYLESEGLPYVNRFQVIDPR